MFKICNIYSTLIWVYIVIVIFALVIKDLLFQRLICFCTCISLTLSSQSYFIINFTLTVPSWYSEGFPFHYCLWCLLYFLSMFGCFRPDVSFPCVVVCACFGWGGVLGFSLLCSVFILYAMFSARLC